jgi:DNA-binding winged helix-turn-helix (wHTH) protein/tetratricopeptide (TPR) repeat protein
VVPPVEERRDPVESGAVDVAANIYFDDWTFLRQPPELLCKGAHVRLQEQPLQVLDELLARPGELVTREHLIARLWPKRIVEFDAGLNAAVRRLRAVLGDEAETPRYIETVPRKGYRFIGILRPLGAVELAPVSDTDFTVSPMTAAAELPHSLSPKRSSFWRRAGGIYPARLMLTAAMILSAIGVFGVLQWRELNAADAGAIAASNEQLRRGDFFTQRRAPGDLARAKQQYELASSLDPSSARAWAGQASVHWLEIAQGEQTREINLPKVRAAAQKALDLDPQLAEAHLRMGLYLMATGNASAARQHCDKAISLQPNDKLVLSVLAGVAADDLRWEEAIVLQRRASAADPLSPTAAANLAYYLFLAGRIEEAKHEFEKVIELDPTHPDEIVVLTQILEGRNDEALRKAETWADGIVRNQALALIYHGLGRAAESSEHLDKLIATVGRSEPIMVAEVYAFRGETDNAFEWLTASRSQPGTSRMLYASPFLKPLQADSRWAQVMERKH